MKLKNGEIFAAREPLQKLAEKELPVKVSFGLVKLVNKLGEPLGAIEQVRNGLVRKYGEAPKDSPSEFAVKVNGENYQKFVDEYNELMEQETELVFDVVRLPEMVDGVTLMIEPSILMALEKFVTVE